ncbi:TolC family protein [Chroococcidiopsis sp [FACHB-1243]]|uniref:TolC family protein n=1 Tax=Chroococcidiopsis sp. [FACHB-1243] TaxID=2692781 RepID=UPI001F54905A|nr:TolC family protein [Chroococcidiopsis sp. [FACHB-1243]]
MTVTGVSTVVFLSQIQSTSAQTKPVSLTAPSMPDSLNPSPNPLDLPTRPEQVRLQQAQPITLQQAIALAQRNNRELQVARQTLQRSQAALKQARAAQLPTLSGEAEFSRQQSASNKLDDLDDGKESSPETPLGGTLEVGYDIFTSGRRSGRIGAAQEQVRFDRLDVERLNEQTRLDVSNTYYDLQEADEQVRISQAAVNNAQRSLQDAIALEEGGLVAQFDIVRARVQLGNAEQELIDAQSQQDIARRQLVELLSLSETVDVSAADPVRQAGEWKLSLEESIVLAYKNRVELQQQLAQRRIAEQQRRVALAEARPQISLFANYQVLDDLSDEFDLQDGYAAGARLRWNFFSGGAARFGAAQESSNRAIAETRFAQTRNQIRFQVEQAYKNLQANARSIQTATAALQQAQLGLETARVRFQGGVGTQLDVISAENDLTRAQVNRLNAILNYNRALATLQRAVSNLSESKPISNSK